MAIEDFGQKIGGARKDLRGTFRREDLQSLTHIERTKMVRKDMVWPTPDYVQLVKEGGYTRESAAMLKMLRDAFPAAPVVRNDISEADYITACELYVEGINALKDTIKGCTTKEAIAAAIQNSPTVREVIGTLRDKNDRYSAMKPSPTLERWRGPEMNLSFNQQWSILVAVGQAATQELDRDTKRMLQRNPNWPAGTTRVDAFLRKESASMELLPDKSGWKFAIYGRVLADDRFDYYRRTSPFGPVLGKVFPNQEAAVEALEAAVQAKFDEKRKLTAAKRDAILGKGDASNNPQDAYRNGPDTRNGFPAEGQDYLDQFKVRGGEFGHWVNQVQRQQVLDRGFDGFCDMARVLGIERDQISLGGTLAIAFGARGNGGALAAAAHYEPGRKVINLTKPHGEGCLAHEVAHAMDHYWGNRAREIGLPIKPDAGVYFLSESELKPEDVYRVPEEARPEAQALVDLAANMRKIWGHSRIIPQEEAIADAIQYRELALKELAMIVEIGVRKCTDIFNYQTPKPTAEDVERKLAEARKVFESVATHESTKHFGSVAQAMEGIRKIVGRKGHLASMTELLEWRTGAVRSADIRVAQASAPTYSDKPREQHDRTAYAKACAKADSELSTKVYYAQKKEMFARALEAVVYDTLQASEQSSPFLVSGTRSAVYPAGAERDELLKSLLPAVATAARAIPRMAPEKAINAAREIPAPAVVAESGEGAEPAIETTDEAASDPVLKSEEFRPAPTFSEQYQEMFAFLTTGSTKKSPGIDI